jgi:hypothetical protein
VKNEPGVDDATNYSNSLHSTPLVSVSFYFHTSIETLPSTQESLDKEFAIYKKPEKYPMVASEGEKN